ncbi:hypothetical protein TWF696_000549 [Orbilia brochopaga]|uniref:Uncharacterized protein n=1 Tax=Orbilia brochopaga TaxID=3140254 RepID=A0AAV9VDY4_9PEZI
MPADAITDLNDLAKKGYDYSGDTEGAYTDLREYLRVAKRLFIILGPNFDTIVAVQVVEGLRNAELKAEIESKLRNRMTFNSVAKMLVSIVRDDAPSLAESSEAGYPETFDLGEWEYVDTDYFSSSP